MLVNPTQQPAWKKLATLHKQGLGRSVRALFDADPTRPSRYNVQDNGLLFDYSRQPITDETLAALCDLARVCEIELWRDNMFSGKAVNTSEQRPALHTALRRPATDTVMVDGINIIPSIHVTLTRMEEFSHAVRSGEWKGYSGQKISDIVNIGIGGSDLGPRMVHTALASFPSSSPTLHFVSNVDGAAIDAVLKRCQPGCTLFVIASKTFTTQETMQNARTAKAWLRQTLPEDAVARHFVALSSHEAGAQTFGIPPENVFPFGEWVGGRYSLWSSIGLSLCLAIGFDAFRQLLDGAHSMDTHFTSAPLEHNIPVLMALLGIWHRNFSHGRAQAIIPYDVRLGLLPDYLQQLDMESNGKSADRDAQPVKGYQTAGIVFGAAGTDAQHSFFQFLHQGTDIVPVDLIAACMPDHPHAEHHALLLANMNAQAQALMNGKANDDARKDFSGNRPVNTILMDRLNPFHLGQLLAAYEHKIFVQGVIWNINSFDQFGVELGKEIAGNIVAGDDAALDPATRHILAYIKQRSQV